MVEKVARRNEEESNQPRIIRVTVQQAAVILDTSDHKVRDMCASGALECRKVSYDHSWSVFLTESRIQPSSYIAIGEFHTPPEPAIIGLDYLIMDRILEYGDALFEANSDYGSPPNSEETIERIKGEICTILRAIMS